MTEVISIKYKSCGKNYFFSPGSYQISTGDKVVVETAKGVELAECTHGNHMVEDTAVIQPLRPVVRIATEQDLKNAEENRRRTADALAICRERVIAHGLDMKLVDAEISFDGSKTLFFFTSDGRVDFRELVKDLAGVFHNRIELRQIGVRDEAKMIGGIGICGRPYCCSVFLDDFAPVSTKMAKVQNLSLNPTKISGSCGRLMCCLRYEEDTYESILKEVPKAGAFVETPDGYGIVTSVALLRQNIKVHLDGDAEGTDHTYVNAAVAVIPGGRPKEGEPYPKVLNYKPEEEEKTPDAAETELWHSPSLFGEMPADEAGAPPAKASAGEDAQRPERPSPRHAKKNPRASAQRAGKPEAADPEAPVKPARASAQKAPAVDAPFPQEGISAEDAAPAKQDKRSHDANRKRRHGKDPRNAPRNAENAEKGIKNIPEAGGKAQEASSEKTPGSERPRSKKNYRDHAHRGGRKPDRPAAPAQGGASGEGAPSGSAEAPRANRPERTPSQRRPHTAPGEVAANPPKPQKKEAKPQARPAEGPGEAAGSASARSDQKNHRPHHHRYYGNRKKPGGGAGEAKP